MFENTRRKLSVGKWLGAGCSSAALAGMWMLTAMVHPSVSKAITMVEMPALVFPAVTAQPNESLMLCTNNLFGDGSVRTLIGLLDVADSSRFVRGTTGIPGSLDLRKGGCVVLLPAVMPEVGALAPVPARTGIPVIFVAGANANAPGSKGLVASVQLVTADGSVRHVTTPTMVDRVLLPAVQ